MNISQVALLLNAGLTVGACLALNGIRSAATEDGWDISYDRLWLALGRVQLGGSGCNAYSNATYVRLLNMQQPGPQKVSESYALGQCDLSFGISVLASDSPLGANVSAPDLAFMRTAATDAFVGSEAMTAYVEGHAVKQNVTKQFAWAFRGRFAFSACATATLPQTFTLPQSGSQTIDLRIRGEALFQDQLDTAAATLRFDPLADADSKSGDNDGRITLDELAQVPLTSLSDLGYAAASGGAVPWQTLGDYVYFGAFPSMVSFGDGGTCTVRFGDDGGAR